MQIIKFDKLDSTNKYIKENKDTLTNYDVVFSYLQTNGKGRNNRVWISNEKENLMFSILIKDEEPSVRAEVARHGYGLDVLVNDYYPGVRATVAEQGYGLDVLVNDEYSAVRVAVAEQGYGLNILINDESEDVRRVVAKQGYGLDILINDKSPFVRDVVEEHYYNEAMEYFDTYEPDIDDDAR